MKAVSIKWDVDYSGDGERLPTEIDIPKGMTDIEQICDYISDVTGFCHEGFNIEKDFLDIEVGDEVICYDEYAHDYLEHRLKITGMEFDIEGITESNPLGIVFYGEDVDENEWGDDYLTRITEINFVRFLDGGFTDE